MTMALDGIRVIDWTQLQMGPVASLILGDLGADVIKIEQPIKGDISRGTRSVSKMSFSLPQGRNFFFEVVNRSKRGITVDVTKREGQEIVYRLVKTADVFVSNFRRGVAVRHGLDFKTLSQVNPKLVYAWGNAFGPDGPDGDKPGVDAALQARSGLMMSVGEYDMPPLSYHGAIADQVGAICLSHGIVVALLARERLGISQEVDVSILGSMIMAQGFNVAARTVLGAEFPRKKRAKSENPLYLWYECADGKWLMLAMMWSDRCWPDFCKWTGIGELQNDQRFSSALMREANAEELIVILDGVFAGKPQAEWRKIYDEALSHGADIVFSVVNAVSDLPDDAQVIANEYIAPFMHPALGEMKVVGLPFKFSETPWIAGGSTRREAPELGQHTEEVLLEVGYSWDEIAEFKDGGVI